MSIANRINVKIAKKNNRLILAASLGRLFPVKLGPKIAVKADWKIQAVHDPIDQLRCSNKASVSLTALINEMFDAPRKGRLQG